MPLINLSLKHGRTLEEARRRLETAVREVHNSCGALVQHVQWSADHCHVRLDGVGFWVEMGSMPKRSTSRVISPCWVLAL